MSGDVVWDARRTCWCNANVHWLVVLSKVQYFGDSTRLRALMGFLAMAGLGMKRRAFVETREEGRE